MYDIPYIWNGKRNDTNVYLQNRLTEFENEIMVGSSREERILREFGMNMYTLLCLKWITNKDPLYSTWNSGQCYVADWMGKEFGGEWMHVYV